MKLGELPQSKNIHVAIYLGQEPEEYLYSLKSPLYLFPITLATFLPKE